MVIAAIAIVLATPAAADARRPSGKCSSATGTVIAEGPLAVAYIVERSASGLAYEQLVGCVRASGRKRFLGEFDSAERPSRVVAVHGTTVGYVTLEITDGAVGDDYTIINLNSLRRSRHRALRGFYVAGGPAILGLDVTNRGAAAWVEDDADGRRLVATASVQGYTTPIVQLTTGLRIRARSIRIERKNRAGQRVSWIQDGRRHWRPLPPRS
jgi:hypothetical protein